MKSTIRLSKALQNILTPYGEEGGVAIRNMKVMIDDLEKVLALSHAADEARSEERKAVEQEKKHWTNTGPVGGHDKRYWEELKDKVKEAIMEMQR